MNTIRQMAEERRNRKQSTPQLPPTRAGEEWGTCVAVYEVDREKSRVRKVARVLLASGFVVTAYLAANAPAPAVDSTVLVSGTSGGDCCGVASVVPDGGGPGDAPPPRYTVSSGGGPGDAPPPRYTVNNGGGPGDAPPPRYTVTES